MSMTRKQVRENIFKLLFRVEFNSPEEMPEQEKFFLEEMEDVSEEDAAEISDKYKKIDEKLADIDKEISEKATGWTIDRMGKVELTIIRLAVYEIRYDEEVPAAVAINEAVELAKKFGREESSAFVNAVLKKFTV